MDGEHRCNGWVNLDVMFQRAAGTVEALLIAVSEGMHALLLGALQNAGDGVDAHVQAFDRRAEGEPNVVMTGRGEEVAAV